MTEPMKCERERWKPVVDYEDLYLVSNTGKVKGLKFNKELKQSLSVKGYLMVTLYRSDDEKLHTGVHRVVARAFLKNPKNKTQINHIDSNRTNNILSNIEWCTPKENIQHMIKFGKYRVGVECKSSKLKEEQVIEIRELYKSSKISFRTLGKMFNLHPSTVGDIIYRNNWKHI